MDLSHIIDIANISVKKSETDHELLTVRDFLQIPIAERLVLVEKKRLEFIDFDGNKIPVMEGLKQMSKLIKHLKKEGLLMDFISR